MLLEQLPHWIIDSVTRQQCKDYSPQKPAMQRAMVPAGTPTLTKKLVHKQDMARSGLLAQHTRSKA
jgi:hypothetical protein